MRYSPSEPGLITNYVRYGLERQNECVSCQGPVEDAYVSAGHRYRDFRGEFNEIRYLKRCLNPACPLFNRAYNPNPSEVLPYKQFSFAVWKWIAEEWLLYQQNAESIQHRIQTKFGLSISENTIRNYLDEIDVLTCDEIDDKTRNLLKIQGIIILALDGQKPEENGKALWLFVDLLSNRVLKIVILESADSITLHPIVEEILAFFHVKMVGMVSDKQNNLTKLHDDWYKDIPHQYCHFHFLQNIWTHLEVKDTALRQCLAKGIKNLYIVHVSKQTTKNFTEIGKQPIRAIFGKVEKKLRRIVKARTKKFEKLGGIKSFQDLEHYLGEMDALLAQEDSKNNGIALLLKTADDIRTLLADNYCDYQDCVVLFEIFQRIQAWLKEPGATKEIMLANGDALFDSLWENASKKKGLKRADLCSFLAKKGYDRVKIELEAVRLYDSYRDGLFAYYDFPVKIRTNCSMEQAIGQEKGRLRKRNSKANVGSQIRIRGEYELKKVYAGQEEIENIIHRMGPNYNEQMLKEGLRVLASRRGEETENIRVNENDESLLGVIASLKASRNTEEE